MTCWLLAGLVTTVPYVVAALAPPPGHSFVGTFHWIDDFYNYVSFVQQAEDGHFLFDNKLRLEHDPRALVNLEWWSVGVLSRLCGRRPFLAYRLFALAVLGCFLLAVDRALRRGGFESPNRLPALALVVSAGGLGGLLFELTPRTVFHCADLSVGLYPFFEMLANPHWLVGTWLLLETSLALDGASSGRDWMRAAGLGTALGLVRPYDLVLAALVHGVCVPFSTPPRDWLRKLAPLAAFAPVALYNYWVFYRIPTFSSYAVTHYEMPPPGDFLWALGPVGLLALSALRRPPENRAERSFRLRLWAWTLIVVLAIVWRPVTFTQQFLVGAGLPLLLLAGLGLSTRPRTLAVIAVLLCSTSLVALRIVSEPDPAWFVPAERRAAALAMRPHCRDGDLAFAPDDIGLYAIGLTSCRAFVSHPWAPDLAERQAIVRGFYGPMPMEARRRLIDRLNVALLALPGDAGPTAAAWLGEGAPFTQVALLGPPPRTLSVYARARAAQ